MPFTCEACGRRSVFPDLIPAVGDVLRCPHCADERLSSGEPLLVVTGTAGIGKSTLCARLAGTIPGALLLDADIVAEDLVSVTPPNQDYPAFWRSMMRLAHELAQNNVEVVYFSTMLPEQVLANSDVLGYFDSVHFLCLTCPPDVLSCTTFRPRRKRGGRCTFRRVVRLQQHVDSGRERDTHGHSRRCRSHDRTTSSRTFATGSTPSYAGSVSSGQTRPCKEKAARNSAKMRK